MFITRKFLLSGGLLGALGLGLLVLGCQSAGPAVTSGPTPPRAAPTPLTAQQDEAFNKMYSDKEMGYSFQSGMSTFRLFVPRGKAVKLVVFAKYDDASGTEYDMKNDGNQVFEIQVPGPLWGKFYGYKITDRTNVPALLNPDIPLDTVFADPYSRAMAQSNTFPQKSRTLIFDTSKYEWAGDKPTGMDISQAVIMEAHLRDLTADKTAEVPGSVKNPGSFKGFLEAKRGGLAYVKYLGINTVEFLPVQDFGNVEPPFNVKTPYTATNRWNAYAENYWGYMTSNFFAPEGYYASDGTMDPTAWNGTDGRAVNEFKDVVKALHKAGVSVLMDVVYNHVSQYDENALKLIDNDFYFKPADRTGTGNEVQTRRPMVRKLVTDSLQYWMRDYHIDGFRFDLAASFDQESAKIFLEAIRKVNPKGFVIAEPWGGEGLSNSTTLAAAGWSMWDPEIRSVLKGETRPTGPGNIFPLGNNTDSASQLETPWSGGNRKTPSQSVAYVECHDDSTYGDALRIESGEYHFLTPDRKINRIKDVAAYQKLSPPLVRASKLAAVALFLSETPIMIHAGQEWGRGKVTPDLQGKIPELQKGGLGASSDNVIYLTPAPNSYSADNETNWLNFDYARLNQDLLNYYRGLIALRESNPYLGKTDPHKINVLYPTEDNGNSLGLDLAERVFGFVNSDPSAPGLYDIPQGTYSVVVDGNTAGTKELRTMAGGHISVPPGTSLILIKK